MRRSVRSVVVLAALLVVALQCVQSAMGALTLGSTTAYVNALSVGACTSTGPGLGTYPTFTNGTQQGVVVGSGAAGFTKSVSAKHRDWVTKSMLLAQLASDAKYSKVDDVIDWYNNYATVLGNIGWAIDSFSFTQLTITDTKFEVNIKLQELLAAIMTGDEPAVFLALMDSLNTGGDTYKLFEDQSTAFNQSTFQVALAGEDAYSVVSLSFGATYIDATAEDVNILWFDYTSKSFVYKHNEQSMELSDDVYPEAAINDKLKCKAPQYVDDLNIGQ